MVLNCCSSPSAFLYNFVVSKYLLTQFNRHFNSLCVLFTKILSLMMLFPEPWKRCRKDQSIKIFRSLSSKFAWVWQCEYAPMCSSRFCSQWLCLFAAMTSVFNLSWMVRHLPIWLFIVSSMMTSRFPSKRSSMIWTAILKRTIPSMRTFFILMAPSSKPMRTRWPSYGWTMDPDHGPSAKPQSIL